MQLNWINRLGDWNPQLLREIKGRLKTRNVLIAVAISVMGQMLMLMSFRTQLPADLPVRTTNNPYCTGINPDYPYSTPTCLWDSLGHVVINWQKWWLDVFVWLSIIGVVTLLVVGTYMLIADLSKEENRGTLNFIRLSPQSTTSILSGKLLGSPILLYLVAGLAIPLHLYAGLSAAIPLNMILAFDAVGVASCFCLYSVAALFSLVASGLGGFQAWLASGSVLMFAYALAGMTMGGSSVTQTSFDWLHMFSPIVLLRYLMNASIPNYESAHRYGEILKLSFFGIGIGVSFWSMASLALANCCLWGYWAWRSLKRCFHNPTSTILSKRQSYAFTACYEVAILGFAFTSRHGWEDSSRPFFENLMIVLCFNLVLFLFLMAAVSPHRQALQDWARYRREDRKSKRFIGLVKDLVWGEKSPSVLAIALNLAIAATMILPWIVVWPDNRFKFEALAAVLLSVNVFLIYSAIAQLMLLMKTPKRAIWAASTVAALIVLPPIALLLLSIEPKEMPLLWMFSAFGWAALEETSAMMVLFAALSQLTIVGLLSVQLTRQMRLAGESATKALLAGRSATA